MTSLSTRFLGQPRETKPTFFRTVGATGRSFTGIESVYFTIRERWMGQLKQTSGIWPSRVTRRMQSGWNESSFCIPAHAKTSKASVAPIRIVLMDPRQACCLPGCKESR